MKVKWEKGNKRIIFEDFSITLREVLVVFIAMALLFTLGIKISDAIERKGWENSKKYQTAAQAKDSNTYQWLVKTSIGNLLAEGTAECIDPVHMDGVDGVYWYIERDYEQYREHSRQVAHTYTDSDGHTHTYYTTEYYWTWDVMDTEKKSAKQFTFLGLTYNNGDLGISRPAAAQIKVDDFAYHERYVYYGAPTTRTGVVFTNIIDGKYSDSFFADGNTIESFLIAHTDDGTVGKTIFWCFWITLMIIIGCVYIFIDNEYLED